MLIKATPRFRAEDKKDVKSHQTTLRIWVGADGLPGEPRAIAHDAAGDWLRALRNRWEAANNRWNQLVLGYNPQRQSELLS